MSTSNAKLPAKKTKGEEIATSGNQDYVTMTIAEQLFGIPVLQVQDVLGHQKITRIPLAPPEVAGSLNLRGRIVTAIDVRLRLNLPARPKDKPGMSIVVDLRGELYSLMVDSVGEVLSLSNEDFERNPATLDPRWREVSTGIYRLNGQLMVVLDVPRLLNFTNMEAA
jgi:purine-binding chemotaxis protein CheW